MVSGLAFQLPPRASQRLCASSSQHSRVSERGGQRSEDQGQNWTPLPGAKVGSNNEIEFDPENSNRLYAATGSAISIWDGKSWSVRDERHGLQRNAFGGFGFDKLAVDPKRPKVIYAGQRYSWVGVAGRVFRSTDGGDHWENVTRNLGPDLTVWALTVSPHDGFVWLGTDYGNWKLPPPQ